MEENFHVTTVRFEAGLPEKARFVGVNISRCCNLALKNAIRKLEAQDVPAKKPSRAVTPPTASEVD